jgi:hypothetical protein
MLLIIMQVIEEMKKESNRRADSQLQKATAGGSAAPLLTYTGADLYSAAALAAASGGT